MQNPCENPHVKELCVHNGACLVQVDLQSYYNTLFCCYNDCFTWQEAGPSSDGCFFFLTI